MPNQSATPPPVDGVPVGRPWVGKGQREGKAGGGEGGEEQGWGWAPGSPEVTGCHFPCAQCNKIPEGPDGHEQCRFCEAVLCRRCVCPSPQCVRRRTDFFHPGDHDRYPSGQREQYPSPTWGRREPSDRWGQEERPESVKRPHDNARTGYTPPTARGRRTAPPGRDDAARKEPQDPQGAGRGEGRRRAREETEEEYSATGKGAKDSRREAEESPGRPRHWAGSTPPDRQAEEAFYREYPDCPQGT